MSTGFEAAWFDACLRDMGLSHADLARALGFSLDTLRAVWRGERPLTDAEFRVLAMMLGAPEIEVRHRAGRVRDAVPVARPQAPDSGPEGDAFVGVRIRALEHQLDRIEGRLERLMRHLGVQD